LLVVMDFNLEIFMTVAVVAVLALLVHQQPVTLAVTAVLELQPLRLGQLLLPQVYLDIMLAAVAVEPEMVVEERVRQVLAVLEAAVLAVLKQAQQETVFLVQLTQVVVVVVLTRMVVLVVLAVQV
jgi:hypothetical protein